MRNTSQRDSREVVQVYLQPAEADQPVRLVGWVSGGPPGDSAIVTVDCDARLWRRWDTEASRWARWRTAASCWSPGASATSVTGCRWPDGST